MIENLPNEVWKPIIGFPKYQISNMGRVQGAKGIITPYNKIHTEYKIVNLYDSEHRSHKFSLHRIVAKHFLPNPNNLPEINHIDENPANNRVSNLEWCDRNYNTHYGGRCQRIKDTSPLKKSVDLYRYGTNELVGTYESITEVAEEIGATVSNICATLHGRRKHAKGYYLKFHDKEATLDAIDAALDYLIKNKE